MQQQKDRRSFLLRSLAALPVGALLVARPASAQKPAKLPKLGILDPHPAAAFKTRDGDAVSNTMKKLGWIEGENLIIERAYGEGHEDRIIELAAELVRKQVDVIWAHGSPCTLAAAKATKTIPIVFWGAANVVELGLVDSLARPGRNVTGVAYLTDPSVTLKSLQYLKEVVPGVARVAWITVTSVTDVTVAAHRAKNAQQFVSAAQEMGMEVQVHPVQRVEDFDSIFAAILKSRAQAIYHYGHTITVRERRRITDFAIKNGLASAFGQRDFVEAGGLLSYGADWWATWPRGFAYVDRILRGAKPSELPVDLPHVYELVVNLRTARALGMTVPNPVLVRADRLIE